MASEGVVMMGEGLLLYIQTKIKKEYKTAFVSAFLITLFIHLYKFTNTLPNQDAFYNYYSDQNVLGSGRWALTFACGISSYFDLPWVIGLISCVFIALTASVIVAIFQLRNPVLTTLVGALLAASPATTETFFFLFTADGYMIAMFLSAVAVYFSRIDEKRVLRWFLSGICICISCGIYQAYVSFALLLSVCYFIDILFLNKFDVRDCLWWVVRQAIIYIASLLAYYAIWKLLMAMSGVGANNYQGISNIGEIHAGLIVNGLIAPIKFALLYFLQWNVFVNGFTVYSALNAIFFALMGIGLLIAAISSGILKRKWAMGLLALCLIAIVPFACIWCFISGDIWYRPMMLQCFTLLFVLVAVLYERWGSALTKNIFVSVKPIGGLW